MIATQSSTMDSHGPALPVELISGILSFVDSSATLLNAACCSRAWYDIAKRHLYHNIAITRIVQYEEEPEPRSNIVLRKLVVLLLREPELAKHVRHFSFRPTFPDDQPEFERFQRTNMRTPQQIPAPPSDIEDEIKHAIAKYSRTELEHLYWLHNEHLEDSLVALLLPSLINLETLDIEFPHCSEDLYFERVLRDIAQRVPPFDTEPALHKLHSFIWVHESPVYGGTITDVGFRLPNVTSIFFHRIGTYSEEEPDMKLSKIVPGSSSVTHLELKDCRFSGSDIGLLLNTPKHLTTFIYELGWGHLAYCNVHFADIRAALEVHKDTLENIWLTYPHDGIEFDGPETGMESFSSFSKLKRLRIAKEFIWGCELTEDQWLGIAEPNSEILLSDFLPRSIEEFHIDHADGTMEAFAAVCASVTRVLEEQCQVLEKLDHPNLRRVTIETCMSILRLPSFRLELEHLRSIAKSYGVSLRLLNNWDDVKEKSWDHQVERHWGMDEEWTWAPCTSEKNMRPVYGEVAYDEDDGEWVDQELRLTADEVRHPVYRHRVPWRFANNGVA